MLKHKALSPSSLHNHIRKSDSLPFKDSNSDNHTASKKPSAKSKLGLTYSINETSISNHNNLDKQEILRRQTSYDTSVTHKKNGNGEVSGSHNINNNLSFHNHNQQQFARGIPATRATSVQGTPSILKHHQQQNDLTNPNRDDLLRSSNSACGENNISAAFQSNLSTGIAPYLGGKSPRLGGNREKQRLTKVMSAHTGAHSGMSHHARLNKSNSSKIDTQNMQNSIIVPPNATNSKMNQNISSSIKRSSLKSKGNLSSRGSTALGLDSFVDDRSTAVDSKLWIKPPIRGESHIQISENRQKLSNLKTGLMGRERSHTSLKHSYSHTHELSVSIESTNFPTRTQVDQEQKKKKKSSFRIAKGDKDNLPDLTQNNEKTRATRTNYNTTPSSNINKKSIARCSSAQANMMTVNIDQDNYDELERGGWKANE